MEGSENDEAKDLGVGKYLKSINNVMPYSISRY
jgi:hypothetical protein